MPKLINNKSLSKQLLNKSKKIAINHGKKIFSIGSLIKGMGLFIGGDYIGGKIEKWSRPKNREELKNYMYEPQSRKESLKHLGKIMAMGFVPVIGDFSSGVYNGYVMSRTRKK